jgi:hypothetical protein
MLRKFAIYVLASAGVLTAAELPTAEAVFKKAIDATGGAAAYEKVKTMSSRGTVEIVGQGIKGTLVSVEAKPDKTDTVMDLAGIGKIHMGTGNGQAWQTSAFQGPRVLEGEERDFMLRESAIDALARWHETYGEVKVDGEETLDGKECWRLVAKAPKASKPETLWFEKESGLLVKSATTMVSPMGEMPMESRYSDYRDEGGLKVAHTLRQSAGPQVILTTLEEITINPELAATQFDVPAEVQALLNKK